MIGKRNRRGSLAVSFMLVTMVAGLALLYWLNNEKAQASSALEEFVAQAIVDEQLEEARLGYTSPEGAILAHVKTVNEYARFDSPIKIWRYEKSQFVEATNDDLFRAVNSKQASDWPSFVYLFSFNSDVSGRVIVDVQTLYNRGFALGSRVAMAQSGNWKRKGIYGSENPKKKP